MTICIIRRMTGADGGPASGGAGVRGRGDAFPGKWEYGGNPERHLRLHEVWRDASEARNCHRSAYHGAELRGAKTVYLYPQYIPELGINRRDFAGRCGKCIAKVHHREKTAGGWKNRERLRWRQGKKSKPDSDRYPGCHDSIPYLRWRLLRCAPDRGNLSSIWGSADCGSGSWGAFSIFKILSGGRGERRGRCGDSECA